MHMHRFDHYTVLDLGYVNIVMVASVGLLSLAIAHINGVVNAPISFARFIMYGWTDRRPTPMYSGTMWRPMRRDYPEREHNPRVRSARTGMSHTEIGRLTSSSRGWLCHHRYDIIERLGYRRRVDDVIDTRLPCQFRFTKMCPLLHATLGDPPHAAYSHLPQRLDSIRERLLR